MDAKSEAQELIERLRKDRASLGNTANTSKKLRYKRINKPIIARVITFGYIFVSGMLFSEVLKGTTAAMISFCIVVVVLFIQLKE